MGALAWEIWIVSSMGQVSGDWRGPEGARRLNPFARSVRSVIQTGVQLSDSPTPLHVVLHPHPPTTPQTKIIIITRSASIPGFFFLKKKNF